MGQKLVVEPLADRDRRPLPVQVHTWLLELIRGGDYPPGSRLPSEGELAKKLGVSRVTVREGIRLLQRDMLIESRQGRGHFVLGPPGLVRKPITELESVTELMRGLGYPSEIEVLSVKTVPIGDDAEHLDLAPDAPVVRLERLRTSLGVPMIYSIDVFSVGLVENFEEGWTVSLLDLLERADQRITFSHATIRAVTLKPSVARRTRLDASQPWVLLQQVNYTSNNRKVLFSLDYHRGDKFEFETLRRRSEASGE